MKLFLIALLLPIGVYAVCFETIQASGTGKTKTDAEIKARESAKEACGANEFSWAQLRGGFKYKQISHDEVIATANFQCCSVW